jgi:hypothetical protein
METSSPSFRAKPAAPANPTAQTERFTSVRQKIDAPARSQRTRRTVDLTPATHRALDIWQREAADRLGLARVTGQEVVCRFIVGIKGPHTRSDAHEGNQPGAPMACLLHGHW